MRVMVPELVLSTWKSIWYQTAVALKVVLKTFASYPKALLSNYENNMHRLYIMHINKMEVFYDSITRCN